MAKQLKDKICKGCGNLFAPRTSLQHLCPKYSCLQLYNYNKSIKAESKGNKKKTSIGKDKNDARKYFQMFIRLRDKNLPCISCGDKFRDKWDGGHYLKAEIYSGLIFNEINCNKQCVPCNQHKDGNPIGYRIGLIAKYGEDVVKELEDKADSFREHKYTSFELLELKTKYKLLLKPKP